MSLVCMVGYKGSRCTRTPLNKIYCYLLQIVNGHKTSRWSSHLPCSETILLQNVHPPSFKKKKQAGWRRKGVNSMPLLEGLFKSLKHTSSGATDLLSASMFVKSPAEFIPIQDESSNFGHVAGKHCLHA